MMLKAVFPGKYIQGEGVLEQLPQWIKVLGRKGLILASRTVKDKILVPYSSDWASDAIPIESFHGECCEREVDRLSRLLR